MAKKSTKSSEPEHLEPLSSEPEPAAKPKKKRATKKAKMADPIGDLSDGEGHAALEPATTPEDVIAAAEDNAETNAEADGGGYAEASPETAATPEPDATPEADSETASESDEEDEPEFKPRPPAKLDRLQKILAQAGVASRRKAEEMIEQGRVQVNGKVVTELGTKADAGRDHIRVDGKLLQGAERLRYFVLNKPKGFVTTVKDPEGRPTVMQFFDKMRERLYPVGRLDYMSEGLLLVTNDGELANRLTRASAGVEKTYLVKVAGIPTEDELDQLRSGVAIERGKPGSAKVRTSPARIRQVRQGDNPWYEVVLIEGRNRELRKMFEEIGHFVEKIRRVGYGPLILDQEPGNLRELDAQELAQLRQAADGTLRTPKSKDVRRRNLVDAGQLPTVSPRFSSPRPSPGQVRPFAAKSFEERPAAGPKDYKPKRSFSQTASPDRPARPAGRDARTGGKDFSSSRSSGQEFRPNARPSARPAWQKDDRPARPPARFDAGPVGERRPSAGKSFGAKPFAGKPFSARPYPAKPFAAKPFDPGAPPARTFGNKPPSNRPFAAKPAGRPHSDRPGAAKPSFGKPAWNKSGPKDRPNFSRPAAPRPAPRVHDEDLGPVRPPNLHIEEIRGPERPFADRPSQGRPAPNRPSGPRSGGPRPAPYTRPGRPSPDRARSDRAGSDRLGFDRPRPNRSSQGRSSQDRPGPARPSSGRTGSGRPSSGRPFRSEGGPPRPFTTSSGKPRAGGARPSSKPKPGGFSSYKGKSSGPKRTGKPGGKKR
jgi:23S rRNA pseudouridine2605 synthase